MIYEAPVRIIRFYSYEDIMQKIPLTKWEIDYNNISPYFKYHQFSIEIILTCEINREKLSDG